MTNPIELARELGKSIQNDERYLRFDKAKVQNDLDEELQSAIGEFNLKRINLNSEMNKDTKDSAKISALNKEVGEIYQSIMNNESMKEYSAAKEEMDELMRQINTILTVSVSGEDPENVDLSAGGGCSGNCGGCSGCN